MVLNTITGLTEPINDYHNNWTMTTILKWSKFKQKRCESFNPKASIGPSEGSDWPARASCEHCRPQSTAGPAHHRRRLDSWLSWWCPMWNCPVSPTMNVNVKTIILWCRCGLLSRGTVFLRLTTYIAVADQYSALIVNTCLSLSCKNVC